MRLTASRARLLVPLVMVIALALVASACGGGGSSASSETTSESTKPESNTGESEGGSAASEEAKAEVEKFSTLPTKLPYTEELTKSVEGKNVYFLKPDVPVGVEIGEGIEAASKVLGINAHVLNAGTTPATYKAALQEVVSANPPADGLIISGQEPTFYRPEFNQLAAQGVPVVASSVAEYEGLEAIKGRAITVQDWQAAGRLAANYVYSENNGEGNVAFFDLANFPIINEGVGKGFTEQYEKVCPGCSFDHQVVQASTIGTELPGIITSYLQKNPETKWIFAGIGDELIGVPQALQAAGISGVSALSYSATEPNYQYVEAGQLQKGIIGYPNKMSAWIMVNQIAQAINGQEVQEVPIPLQVITKENIDPEWVKTGWPGVENFEQQFEELWANVAVK